MFQSTKIIELGSCAFRQPRAKSHCSKIHGYRLQAKFWFEADELDENHWVVDFGALKGLRDILEKQFDHTTCIAADDEDLDFFKEGHKRKVFDLRIMPNGTGIERIAEFCYGIGNDYVESLTLGRCRVTKVEVWEHEKNSATYSTPAVESQQDAYAGELEKHDSSKEGPQVTKKVAPSPVATIPAKKKPKNTWISDNANKNTFQL